MDPAPPELTGRLRLAVEAARSAGRSTLKYFRQAELVVDRKADDTPVTVADRQAEEELRRQITGRFPDDAILGEEFPDRPGTSGFRWILDPIDGTKSFIRGVPLYGTLVGLEHAGQPVLGVIVIPAIDEYVYAARGQGAWYGIGDQAPRPARVSDCSTLEEGLFVTSEVGTFDESDRRDAFDRLHATARMGRTWGDCYGYMLVATGRAELMVDPIVEVWDVAALLPIIEEAGGTFTDWQGRPTIHSREAIATNGRIFDQVMGLIGSR